MKTFIDRLIFVLFGFVLGAMFLAFKLPDQPPETCVPIYHQAGLECCKE